MMDAEATAEPGSKANPTNIAGVRSPQSRVRLVVTIDTECDKAITELFTESMTTSMLCLW